MSRRPEDLRISGGAESLINPEIARVTLIRGIQSSDFLHILKWQSDEETRIHLDPPPARKITDWNNIGEINQGMQELQEYYRNRDEDPKKITPLVAINSNSDPIGVLTIRWRGDPLISKDSRVASFETFMADPALKGKGIGTQLLSAALDVAFNIYRGYSGGQAAKEVRLWVMSDVQAGIWQNNYALFRKFGFVPRGEGVWKEIADKRGIKTDRDAIWLKLPWEKWEEVMDNNSSIGQHASLDLVNLRL